MQDPEAKEIGELQSRVADVKARLRQLDLVHSTSGSSGQSPDDVPLMSSLRRAKHHLELALEALGAPKFGFASAPASSLQLTGFYSSDIYKALQDLRSKTRGEDAASSTDEPEAEANGTDNKTNRRQGQASGRRKSDRTPNTWAKPGKKKRRSKGKKQAEPSTDEQAEPVEAGAVSDEQHSTWVQHRVDEIHRALSAAFGEDDLFGGDEPDAPIAPIAPSAPEFFGNTDALSIPELIGFFQLQGKTGVLTVDAKKEQFTLEYLNGELIHAGSSSAPDGYRLGEVLVKLGHITQSKLDRLIAGKSSAERIGDALRRGDVVSDQALAEALQYQIQNIFYRLFDLGGCRFSFREGLDGEPSARIRYNVTRLLLETARHRDELEGAAERRAS